MTKFYHRKYMLKKKNDEEDYDDEDAQNKCNHISS